LNEVSFSGVSGFGILSPGDIYDQQIWKFAP